MAEQQGDEQMHVLTGEQLEWQSVPEFHHTRLDDFCTATTVILAMLAPLVVLVAMIAWRILRRQHLATDQPKSETPSPCSAAMLDGSMDRGKI
jgi:hypothetical protein